MSESFWQKDRMATHILFDLCLFKHFSPVANFGDQSLVWLECVGPIKHVRTLLGANLYRLALLRMTQKKKKKLRIQNVQNNS